MMPVRIRRLLVWVALPALILVLLYTVLGFYLVPRLVRSSLHDFVAKNYHREIALGDVRFNPYTLRLDVSDFTLPDSDGQPISSLALEASDDIPIPSPTVQATLKGKAQRQLLAALRAQSNGETIWTLPDIREVGRKAGMPKNTARSAAEALTTSPFMTPMMGGWRLSHV